MSPCAAPMCPALATRGEFCPVHASGALEVVCAWCKRQMRPGAQPVSHGICPDCRGSFDEELAVSAEERAEAVRTRERISRLYQKVSA